MTLCAVISHVRVLLHSGPLWRDEVNGLNVAMMPTLGEIWQSIIYYPFPILHDLILRAWIAIGFGQGDFQLRILAFVLALLLLATLWASCYMIERRRPPLWPLALLALNPVAIQTGDWVRPYTLAMILNILAFAAVFNLTVREFSVPKFLVALVAALLAAQTVFQNAVVVFAICVAGILALAWQSRWKAAIGVLAVGLAAAISLGPYFPMLRQARSWSVVARMNYGIGEIVQAGFGVLTGHNGFVAGIWIVTVVVTIGALTLRKLPVIIGSTRCRVAFEPRPTRWVFATVVFVVGAAGMIAFISTGGWLMDRYFVPFAAVASFCIYLATIDLTANRSLRWANLVGSVAVAAMFVPADHLSTVTRSTNCDRVAAELGQNAEAGDLILVTDYTIGISFARYYQGQAAWKTLPDVSDHSQHRWDLALPALSKPEPMRETLATVETTLKAGHKIFIVGALPPSDPSLPASAPAWTGELLRKELAQFLHQHLVSNRQIPVNKEGEVINPLEDLPLFVGTGWRESPNDQ